MWRRPALGPRSWSLVAVRGRTGSKGRLPCLVVPWQLATTRHLQHPAEEVVCNYSMTQTSAHAQSTISVLMIRPRHFYPNPETAADNAFQARMDCAADALSEVARQEFDAS